MIKHESTKNTKPKEMEDEEGAVIGKGEREGENCVEREYSRIVS